MRKILFACLAAALVSPAHAARTEGHVQHRGIASDSAEKGAKALLARLKANRPKSQRKAVQTLDTPLLAFLPAPTIPLQGSAFNVVIEAPITFVGNRQVLSLDYSANGGSVQSAPLIDGVGMFSASLGTQTLIGPGYLDATLYTLDSAKHQSVINSVAGLDHTINNLTTQINAQRDPALRAELQEQRGEDLALKGELLTELNAYRTVLTTQRYSYTVQPDPNSATNPKITAVAPTTGNVRGGTQIQITGANFTPNFVVLIGGLAAQSATFVNSTTITAVTPDFGSSGAVGPKDVEIRFTSSGILSLGLFSTTTNAIFPGGFIAQVVNTNPTNQKPVAVATGSQKIQANGTATLDGTQSYSQSGSTLAYSWSVSDAPMNSGYAVGTIVGTSSTLAFKAHAVGTYVLALTVTDRDSTAHLTSEPSLAVVQVVGAPKPMASPIQVSNGQIATTQIIPNDPTPGEDVTYSITQQPVHGTATVSISGLVTFSANNDYLGADSMVVQVTAQSGLTASLTIPITIYYISAAPHPAAPNINTHTEPGTSQITVPNASPGQTFSYSILTPPSNGFAKVDANGLVTYASNTGFTGNDVLTIQVTDNAPPHVTGQTNIQVIVSPNSTPQVSATAINMVQGGTGTSQLTITDDAGQIDTKTVGTGGVGTATVDANGVVTYIPPSNFYGTTTLTVNVTDNGNPALTGSASIPVHVNAIPVISASPAIQVPEGGQGTSQVSASDPDGDALSYSISAAPAHGTATISATGLVSYTPAAGYAAGDSIGFTVADSGVPSASVAGTVSVTVVPPPVASASPITVYTGMTQTDQVTASDTDGHPLIYAISAPPTKGTATISSSGLVSYSAGTSPGSDSIGVTVIDSGFPTLSTTISIPVTINQNPLAISAPAIIGGSGESSATRVKATDNTSGANLTYTISTPPTKGTATISSTGLVFYTANAGTTGATDTIGVTVSDDATPQASGTISIPVSILDPTQVPVLPNQLFRRILSQGVPVQVGLSISNASTNVTQITSSNSTIASVGWDFGDGGHELTSDHALGGILHNYVDLGTYTAVLWATDTNGATTAENFSVNVINSTIPTAIFTASPANNNGGVLPVTYTFDASASSDPSGITQYRWLFCGGSPLNEIVTTTPTISKTFSATTTCTVRLRTRNANNVEGISQITVHPGSNAGYGGVAQFTVGPPREVLQGAPLSFDGSRSFNANVGGSLVAYNWTFSDPGCSSCTATGVNPTYSYSSAGWGFNRIVSLKVTSQTNATFGPGLFEVFPLTAAGHIPHAVMYPSTAGSLTMHFDGSDSYGYDGAKIILYQWFFGDGSAPVQGATASHTFAAAGAYQVTLQVNDNNGNADTVTQSIQVSARGSALEIKPRVATDYDPDREYQRQLLAGACANRDAEACSALGDMYADDGNTYMSSQLHAKACSMGYQPACSARE